MSDLREPGSGGAEISSEGISGWRAIHFISVTQLEATMWSKARKEEAFRSRNVLLRIILFPITLQRFMLAGAGPSPRSEALPGWFCRPSTRTISPEQPKGSADGCIGDVARHTSANMCGKRTDLELLLRETASWSPHYPGGMARLEL